MNRQVLSLLAGAFAVVALASGASAEDAKPMTGAQQSKLKVASGVIAIGRADKDPMMLVVGAKILSGLGAGGSGTAPENASNALEVSAILDEAKAMAGDNAYLLEEISTLAGRPERSGERYCNWYENCGFSIVDPFACEQVMVCD